MKARLIAILILFVLIGLPIFGYWYFFRANISGVQIFFGSGVTANVSLRGAFSHGWLPLADKALEYNKICTEFCEFSPILPTGYSVNIFAENFANFSDNFSIKNGEKLIKNYSLTKTANYTQTTVPSPLSSDEKILRNEDIHAILWNEYSVIARDLSGNFWLSKNENQSTQIGIFSGNNFILKKNFPTGFSDISFDFYNNVMIFSHQNNEKILYSLDSDQVFEGKIPENTNKFFFWNNSWNAISDSGIFTEKNGNWSPNLRFSRFVDLGFWRVGFIDEKSENLLKIGNYNPEEWSVFVLMNRQNGETYEIARGLKITELFVYNNAIIFHHDNNFYSVKIPE